MVLDRFYVMRSRSTDIPELFSVEAEYGLEPTYAARILSGRTPVFNDSSLSLHRCRFPYLALYLTQNSSCSL